ncbi:MAG TPA: class I SAM-dependent methyltransferase [Candidatus Limnocylindria bacterium]|nr:class I SAM-dependent methyltransferase [Candidatus Limnocylindria bacterium]
MTRVEHAPGHAHDHGAGLTERQRIEAQVYDERVRASMAALTDDELRVDAAAIPFPNREHEEFLTFALGRLGEVAGARVLEVGCGAGALSVHLALRGARVTGIDVSAENVALAERRARVNGVGDRADFRAVPIEDVRDPDGTYDAIIGNQVLHHFELDVAMPNIRRLLRPGGKAVFCEPVLLLPDAVRQLRDTPFVKRALPKRVDTPTERSVSLGDVGIIRRTFPAVRLHPFHLLLRVQNFVELGDAAFERLAAVDRAILRWTPPLRRLSRFVVFEASA